MRVCATVTRMVKVGCVPAARRARIVMEAGISCFKVMLNVLRERTVHGVCATRDTMKIGG